MRQEGGGGKTERRGGVSRECIVDGPFFFCRRATHLHTSNRNWRDNQQHMTLRMGE